MSLKGGSWKETISVQLLKFPVVMSFTRPHLAKEPIDLCLTRLAENLISLVYVSELFDTSIDFVISRIMSIGSIQFLQDRHNPIMHPC